MPRLPVPSAFFTTSPPLWSIPHGAVVLSADLIKRLENPVAPTSIVVTHDMRLAEKVADKIVFLYEGKAIFFGTYAQMEKDPLSHRAGIPALDEPETEG